MAVSVFACRGLEGQALSFAPLHERNKTIDARDRETELLSDAFLQEKRSL